MGAIGDPYISLSELKQYLNIDEDKVEQEPNLLSAIESASREVEQYCGRQFNRDEVASTRLFEPDSRSLVRVDDFWSTTDLAVALRYAGGDQDFGTTDYALYPLSGVVDGNPGWPYYRIEFEYPVLPYYVGRKRAGHRGVVAVTAKWGWEDVPSTVIQATKLLAAQTHRMAEAPLGVTGMNNQFGGPVRVRDLPQVATKLNRFVSTPIMVG